MKTLTRTTLTFLLLLLPALGLHAAEGWEDDGREYAVVINHEEQYSIWPTDREVPPGWKALGEKGTKKECLDYIEEVWTDMRPLSLRKKMKEMEQERAREAVYQVIRYLHQFALWLKDWAPPEGWKAEGPSGGQEELQKYIWETWPPVLLEHLKASGPKRKSPG